MVYYLFMTHFLQCRDEIKYSSDPVSHHGSSFGGTLVAGLGVAATLKGTAGYISL